MLVTALLNLVALLILSVLSRLGGGLQRRLSQMLWGTSGAEPGPARGEAWAKTPRVGAGAEVKPGHELNH